MGNFISIFVVLPLLGSNSFDEPKQLKLKDDSFFFRAGHGFYCIH